MVTQRHHAYWRQNLKLTGGLLLLWFGITFGVAWFARDLQWITWQGFPLPFYIAAQGAPLVFVGIVWYYARAMDTLDQKYNASEDKS